MGKHQNGSDQRRLIGAKFKQHAVRSVRSAEITAAERSREFRDTAFAPSALEATYQWRRPSRANS